MLIFFSLLYFFYLHKMCETAYVWWSILVNWQLLYVRLSYKSNENLFIANVFVFVYNMFGKAMKYFLTIQPAAFGYRLMSINEEKKNFHKRFFSEKRNIVVTLFFPVEKKKFNNLYVPDSKLCQHCCAVWMWANRPTKLIRLQNHTIKSYCLLIQFNSINLWRHWE